MPPEKHGHCAGSNPNLLTSRPCGGLGKTVASPTAPPSPCPTLAVSAEGSQACAKGCELCSEVNGCLKCSPKLFILLERNDIRQVGVCLPSCPPGYFDARNPDMNKCISECGEGWRRLWPPGEGASDRWRPAGGVEGTPRGGGQG